MSQGCYNFDGYKWKQILLSDTLEVVTYIRMMLAIGSKLLCNYRIVILTAKFLLGEYQQHNESVDGI